MKVTIAKNQYYYELYVYISLHIDIDHAVLTLALLSDDYRTTSFTDVL